MELGEQCLQLAQRVQDEALLLEAHLAIGVSWFYLGNPALACTHLEHTIALYDPAAAPRVGLSLWRYRPWHSGPWLLCLGPVAAWVSRAGPRAERQGPEPGPAARPSLYAGAHAVLRHPPVSVAPGCAGRPRPGRSGDHRGHRPGICPRAGPGAHHAWLGHSRAGAQYRGPRADTAGSRHVPVDRGGISTAAFSGPAGGGVWPPGPAGRRVGRPGRSADPGGERRGSGTTKRSCIASGANCCSCAKPRATQPRTVGSSTKPRRVFSTPSTWPVSSRQNLSNSAPP